MTGLLKVNVGVLTYRRPEALAAALPLVLAQVAEFTASGLGEARVTVIDNDPAGSARQTIAGFHRDDLSYVLEERPGIAVARNRALDESRDDDLLVFIDDDERPEPEWLSSLVATWRDTRATAVMGRVLSVFDPEPPDFVAAGDFFWRPSMPSGTRISVAAAGNLLLDMDQVRALGVRFDQTLGLGGGEDTLFSKEIIRRGGVLVWCDESMALDGVPPERATVRWVLTRAWSHGNTTTRVDLRLSSTALERIKVRVSAVGGGIARIGGGAARAVFGTARGSRRHQARGLRAMFRGAGMAAAGFGHSYFEYARKS